VPDPALTSVTQVVRHPRLFSALLHDEEGGDGLDDGGLVQAAVEGAERGVLLVERHPSGGVARLHRHDAGRREQQRGRLDQPGGAEVGVHAEFFHRDAEGQRERRELILGYSQGTCNFRT